MNPRLPTLDAVEAEIWRQLGRAAHDKHHAWRTPVLATRDGDGADARVVVLREVRADARELLAYTDARSPKAAQIAAAPHGTLAMWSPSLGWQLRVAVTLSLQTQGLAVSSRWATLRLSPAAQDYMAPRPPGTPLDEGDDEDAAPPSAGDAPDRASRDHFALVVAAVRHIDWLELHRDGHRRARFGDGPACWLQP
jgi:pyridoxamine 5'-phosphate oxidase